MSKIFFIAGVLLMLGVYSHAKNTTALTETNENIDYCQRAVSSLKETKDDIINVIKINTTQNYLYSSTTYTSLDCQHFSEKFTVKDPDVSKGKDALCAVLPSSEIWPGLCSLKVKLCLSSTNCKSIIIKLKRDKNGQYIAAYPSYIELNFDKKSQN